MKIEGEREGLLGTGWVQDSLFHFLSVFFFSNQSKTAPNNFARNTLMNNWAD